MIMRYQQTSYTMHCCSVIVFVVVLNVRTSVCDEEKRFVVQGVDSSDFEALMLEVGLSINEHYVVFTLSVF